MVHRFGINTITKDDVNALTFDAQGQVQDAGNGGDAPSPAGGNGGADEASHLDLNGREDPPTAVDDSVTARADTTITIPVTGNDWDPDGDPIAVDSAGIGKQATHGTVDVLNGTSVSYKPDPGYSGSDSFEYTIVDPSGEGDTATVNVQLFPPGSPNQPPIARADKGFRTRIGRAITIDVLANDIDPERDVLRIATFTPNGSATISETKGPTGLPALRYQPPSTAGIYTFTYQAADPQGGTSPKTQVTVEVSGADAANGPPVANPDAIRLPVGVPVPLDVKANDTDPDGDELTISLSSIGTDAIDVSLQAQQLSITVRPGAKDRSLVFYTLSDGIKEHDKRGEVLVLRIGDTAENRAPVANPDAERVVIGESVKIPVTANDIDPDHDIIRLLTAGTPTGGAGTTIVEGNSVRFTPNLPDIKEPTPVTFTYTITDGNGHEATGNVTVTVLLEALPRAPFARDDFADTEVDKPVNIDVLANDGDPSGGGQPSLTGNPTCPNGGTASRTPDERITYVPPSGQPGTFRCKYTVINRQGLVAEASIIVTVNPALPGNHDPQINPTNTLPTVDLGTTLSIFAADIATDADNDHLVFVSVDNPLNGKAEIRQNGDSILYTAPAIASAEKTPTAVNVSFTISDGNDGNVSGSVSIKINDPSATTSTTPTGTAPATHDIPKNATVGDLVQVDVLFELRESNPSTLTVGPVNLDSGPGSALQVSPSGVVSVIVTGPGNVVIGYTVTNSDSLSSTGKIKITVNEAQTSGSPPVANDDEMIVASGGSGRIDLLANDTGYSDPGDVLDIKLILRPPADFGSVTLIGSQLTFVAAGNTSGDTNLTYELSDGSGVSVGHVKITLKACVDSPPATTGAQLFTPYQTPISIDLNQYVVSGSIRIVSGAGLTGATGVYTPVAGFNGVETVTYTVANGCGQTVEGTVTIDVNQIPVGDNITRGLAHGDQLLLHVNEFASDDEPLKITVLNGNPGWVSWDETTVSGTPPASASGDYTFTATVVDPGGLTATASITLRVTNLAPTAFADQYTTDDSTFSFDPTGNDFDPEGGLLCVQPVNVDPPNGSAIVGPNPAPTCLKSITISLVHGVTHLTYTVRDQGGLTASSTITISSNRPPTVPDATGATNGFPSVDIPLLPTEPDGDDVSVTCNTPVDGDGPNANFDVGISPNLNAGENPKIHPRYNLSVSVQQPFQPGVDDQFHCTVTDSFGRAAVATVTITNS